MEAGESRSGRRWALRSRTLAHKPVTTNIRLSVPLTRVSAANTNCAATRTAWSAASAACSARRPAPPAPSTWRRRKTTRDPTSPGERYAKVYEVNLLRCIFCGDCEEACPTEAIVLGHEFAMANYNRR